MHIAVLAPSPESLAVVEEQNTKQTPHKDKTRVGHNWRDKSATVLVPSHACSFFDQTYPDSILQGVMNLLNP